MDLYTHVLGVHQADEMEKLEKKLDITYAADVIWYSNIRLVQNWYSKYRIGIVDV